MPVFYQGARRSTYGLAWRIAPSTPLLRRFRHRPLHFCGSVWLSKIKYRWGLSSVGVFRPHGQSRTREPQFDIRQTGIIPVKNNSGADRNRFDVLGIDRPIFTPDDSLTAFQNQVSLVGVTPADADHFGKFVVLLEPVKSGRIGMACVSGVCVVRLCVADANHEFADVDDGQAGNLKTGTMGSAYILWREASSGGYCGYGYGYGGLVWAVVRISNISEKPEEWGTV